MAQVVCGVASEAQFVELARAWNEPDAFGGADYAAFALPDHPYLSPANWPPAAA